MACSKITVVWFNSMPAVYRGTSGSARERGRTASCARRGAGCDRRLSRQHRALTGASYLAGLVRVTQLATSAATIARFNAHDSAAFGTTTTRDTTAVSAMTTARIRNIDA